MLRKVTYVQVTSFARSDCYRLERSSCRAGFAPAENVYENRLGHVAHPPSGVQFRRQSLAPTQGTQVAAATG